jgi:outer membrane protein OmpA-like peptidoglycan-associated protein/tetratricopeptide (TPR) repeat protein
MKTKIVSILLFVFLLFGEATKAQVYDASKVSKKAKKEYEQAMLKVDEGDYPSALLLLNQAINRNPTYLDAVLSKAGILSELKRYNESALAYEQAFVIDLDQSREYLFTYAIALAGNGEFKKALQALDRFIILPNLSASSIQAAKYRKKSFEFAVDKINAEGLSRPATIENAGDAINTSSSEYYPTMTINGKQLIVTRRTRGGADEDFFSTDLIEGKWTWAIPLSGKINTTYKEGGQQISPDGNWMVFTAKDYPEGYGSFDIYISYQTPNGWSERKNLGESINSAYWESAPCLSADKKQLYFASDRPGGYGGSDLYVATRMANGKWSAPRNLGAVINTEGDESCPFIHADNETLYFNSNGHPGIGGTDLFYSKKSANGFLTPQNLGYPINTINDEGSLFVTADAATGYFASDRSDSKGGLDIYVIQLNQSNKANTTSWVEGRIYDSLNGKGLMAVVEVIDLDSKLVVSEVEADEQGNYLSVLPLGKNYAFNVSKKGYLFYSGRFEMKEDAGQTQFKNDIPLQPLKKGTSMVLRNIQFETGKYDLLSSSFIEIDKIVGVLSDNPQLRVRIIGHTDSIGKEKENLSLSYQRAKVVVAYLESKGIQADRLNAEGLGDKHPIGNNSTEQGRALNRRTELVIISNE